jgi:hypothetical protein
MEVGLAGTHQAVVLAGEAARGLRGSYRDRLEPPGKEILVERLPVERLQEAAGGLAQQVQLRLQGHHPEETAELVTLTQQEQVLLDWQLLMLAGAVDQQEHPQQEEQEEPEAVELALYFNQALGLL